MDEPSALVETGENGGAGANGALKYPSSYGGKVFYHLLGVLQLVLKFYSLSIVLMIVGVFEAKRTIVSFFNHLVMVCQMALSALLFCLVLLHEMILSLRRNAYSLLNVNEVQVELRLPANVKYSHLHSLFWCEDANQNIRISDDFQSFEILPNNHSANPVSNVSTSYPDDNKNQGVSLSFISSPGISKTQHFNNYKEKWSKRPHWWKVGSIDHDDLLQQEIQTKEASSEDERDIEKNPSEFESGHFILESSPFEQQSENASSTEPTPTKKQVDSATTKMHSKLKLAIESNRHNALSQYAKNLKSFKTTLQNNSLNNTTHMVKTSNLQSLSESKDVVELLEANYTS